MDCVEKNSHEFTNYFLKSVRIKIREFVAEKLCVDALQCASTIYTVAKNIANFALVLANFAVRSIPILKPKLILVLK